MMDDVARARAVWSRWAGWPRWCERYRRAKLVTDDNGNYLRHEFTPPVPPLPDGMAAWASSYDHAAPWYSPWWRGFWGEPDDGLDVFGWAEEPMTDNQRAEWAAGRAAAATAAGATYRAYVDTCRAALRAAGWPDDEIP